MAKTESVYVVDDGGTLLVVPPVVVLANNDSLRVVNLTNQDAAWIVGPEPFGGAVAEIVKAQKAHPAKQVRTTKKLAVYHYQITALQTGQKAKGNSDPMIIVDG